MIITCRNCNSRFNIDAARLKPGGSKVQCSRCKELFTIYPQDISEETPLPDGISPQSSRKPESSDRNTDVFSHGDSPERGDISSGSGNPPKDDFSEDFDMSGFDDFMEDTSGKLKDDEFDSFSLDEPSSDFLLDPDPDGPSDQADDLDMSDIDELLKEQTPDHMDESLDMFDDDDVLGINEILGAGPSGPDSEQNLDEIASEMKLSPDADFNNRSDASFDSRIEFDEGDEFAKYGTLEFNVSDMYKTLGIEVESRLETEKEVSELRSEIESSDDLDLSGIDDILDEDIDENAGAGDRPENGDSDMDFDFSELDAMLDGDGKEKGKPPAKKHSPPSGRKDQEDRDFETDSFSLDELDLSGDLNHEKDPGSPLSDEDLDFDLDINDDMQDHDTGLLDMDLDFGEMDADSRSASGDDREKADLVSGDSDDPVFNTAVFNVNDIGKLEFDSLDHENSWQNRDDDELDLDTGKSLLADDVDLGLMPEPEEEDFSEKSHELEVIQLDLDSSGADDFDLDVSADELKLDFDADMDAEEEGVGGIDFDLELDMALDEENKAAGQDIEDFPDDLRLEPDSNLGLAATRPDTVDSSEELAFNLDLDLEAVESSVEESFGAMAGEEESGASAAHDEGDLEPDGIDLELDLLADEPDTEIRAEVAERSRKRPAEPVSEPGDDEALKDIADELKLDLDLDFDMGGADALKEPSEEIKNLEAALDAALDDDTGLAPARDVPEKHETDLASGVKRSEKKAAVLPVEPAFEEDLDFNLDDLEQEPLTEPSSEELGLSLDLGDDETPELDLDDSGKASDLDLDLDFDADLDTDTKSAEISEENDFGLELETSDDEASELDLDDSGKASDLDLDLDFDADLDTDAESAEISEENDFGLELETSDDEAPELDLDDSGKASDLDLDLDFDADLDTDAESAEISEENDFGLELETSDDEASELDLDDSGKASDLDLDLDFDADLDTDAESAEISEENDFGLELGTSDDEASELDLDDSGKASDLDLDLDFDADLDADLDIDTKSADISEENDFSLELGTSDDEAPELDLDDSGKADDLDLDLDFDADLDTDTKSAEISEDDFGLEIETSDGEVPESGEAEDNAFDFDESSIEEMGLDLDEDAASEEFELDMGPDEADRDEEADDLESSLDNLDLELDADGMSEPSGSEEFELDLDMGPEESSDFSFEIDLDENGKKQPGNAETEVFEIDEGEVSDDFSFEIDMPDEQQKTVKSPSAEDETELFDLDFESDGKSKSDSLHLEMESEAASDEAGQKADEDFDFDLDMDDGGDTATPDLKEKSDAISMSLEMASDEDDGKMALAQKKGDEGGGPDDFSFDLEMEDDDMADEPPSSPPALKQKGDSLDFSMAEGSSLGASMDEPSIDAEDFIQRKDLDEPSDGFIDHDDEDDDLLPGVHEEEDAPPPIPSKSGKKRTGMLVLGLAGMAIAVCSALLLYALGPESIRNQVNQVIFPPPPQVGQIIPVESAIEGRFVRNEKTGVLFVITGEVKNEYSMTQNFIKVRSKLFTADNKKEPALKADAFCGNVLSDKDLSELDMETIKKRLDNRKGDNNSNVGINPGMTVPFMIVFDKLPENLDEFLVEVAGPLPPRN